MNMCASESCFEGLWAATVLMYHFFNQCWKRCIESNAKNMVRSRQLMEFSWQIRTERKSPALAFNKSILRLALSHLKEMHIRYIHLSARPGTISRCWRIGSKQKFQFKFKADDNGFNSTRNTIFLLSLTQFNIILSNSNQLRL